MGKGVQPTLHADELSIYGEVVHRADRGVMLKL
jgi:hypothetical protein